MINPFNFSDNLIEIRAALERVKPLENKAKFYIERYLSVSIIDLCIDIKK